MAVRFDSSGQEYYRTADLPSGSFSVYCWMRLSSDRNAKATVWCLDNGTDFIALQTDTDGTTLRVVDSLGAATGTASLALGTWYWTSYTWASGTGTGTFTFGAINAVDPNIAATAVHAFPSSPTHFRIGASPTAGEWLDGRINGFKVYSGVSLGTASSFQERWTNQPIRTLNLHYWYAFDFASTLDYSGNAYDLSGGTGAYTEAGPPIHWGGPEQVAIPPPPPETPAHPLSGDNIIQINTGGFTGASGAVTLPEVTAQGSHIVICAMSGQGTGSTPNLSKPAGFTLMSGVDGGSSTTGRTRPSSYVKYSPDGNEDTWTLAFSSGTGVACWVAMEVIGPDILDPIHLGTGVGNPSDDSATVTSRSTGTQSTPASYDGLAIALHAARGTTSASPVWSAHTNGFTPVAEATHTDGVNGVALSVSAKSSWSLDAHECTAALDAAANARGQMVMLTGQGGPWAPVIDTMCGFELGTATNITSGSVLGTDDQPPAPWDAVTGLPSVVTSTPRSGEYCLELSTTTNAECLEWWNRGQTADGDALKQFGPYALVNGVETGDADDWHGPHVGRFCVYFPTSAPGADVELWSVEAGSLTNGMTIWYRSATGKLGVKIGTGVEVASDATVPTDVWFAVDYRLDGRTTTWTCDWQVTYDAEQPSSMVAQVQASTAGMTVARFSIVRCGWPVSRTATVRYDDIVCSKVGNNYPLGDYRIAPLLVDPAGTPSVSGNTANFGVMTANGTIGAWSATGARDAVDDIPPVTGASADGAVQVATAATEYMAFPMQTFPPAGTFIPRAIRWYVPGWAASGQPATLGLRCYDGESETVLIAAGDHAFDDTSQIVWLTAVLHGSGTYGAYRLTQARLDAMEARIGYSTDAAPDVGALAILAELAYQQTDEIRFATTVVDGEEITADERLDPVSKAVQSLYMTTPAGRGATLVWTLLGVDDSVHIDPSSSHEEIIGAEAPGDVSMRGLVPDPPAG